MPSKENNLKAFHDDYLRSIEHFRVHPSFLEYNKKIILLDELLENYYTDAVYQCAEEILKSVLNNTYNAEPNALKELTNQLDKEQKKAYLIAATCGVVAAVSLVVSLVFVIPTGGLSLLLLPITVLTAVCAVSFHDESYRAAERKEKLSSFSSASLGLFNHEGSADAPTNASTNDALRDADEVAPTKMAAHKGRLVEEEDNDDEVIIASANNGSNAG
ncbi:MAG: hypothetical protein QNK11_05820 [Legionella sp.]|nr:hypothetical protein [Legionella sp.]